MAHKSGIQWECIIPREEDPCQRCGFQNVVKVEAEVAASRSYGRSRTEINDSNIAGNTGISDAENINSASFHVRKILVRDAVSGML